MEENQSVPEEVVIEVPPVTKVVSPRLARRRLSPIMVIAFSYLALILLGTLILLLPISQRPGVGVQPLDCLFVATSASCMCGLVTVSTADTWSLFGQCVILALIQISALGYMASALLVATLLGIRLGFRAKSPLGETQGIFSTHEVLSMLRVMALWVLGIELLGAVALAVRFSLGHHFLPARAAFEGCFYAIAAFSNAAFDLAPGFLGLPHYGMDLWMYVIIGILAFLGGLGVAVIVEMFWWPRHRRVSLHTRLVIITSLLLVLLGTALFMLYEMRNPQLENAPTWVVSSWFMSVTARTAGYRAVDLLMVSPPTLFILGLLMIIGASPTSSGGGVRTTTLAAIILAIGALLRRRRDIEVFKRRIGGEVVRLALSLVAVYLLAVLVVILGVSYTEIIAQRLPSDAETTARYGRLMFEVISAFSNVGMTAGITPSLTGVSKLLICLSMFLGRVGPLVFIFVFAQPTLPSLRRLPAESVMVG